MERETAMKILKELHDNSLFSNRIALETLIPELADSNDERIRKALLEMVHDTTGDELWVDYNVHKEEALAWLEKQGESYTKKDVDDAYLKGICDAKHELEKQDEQKPILDFKASNFYVSKVDGKIHDMTYNPADKVEPRFKVGDYIVSDYCMGRIVEITNDAYLLDTGQGIPFSCRSIRLWDITKDAKDGDVLIDKSHVWECVFIFKEARPSDIKTDVNNPLAIIGYCGINHIGFTSQLSGLGFGDTVNCTYYPATKEQRDLLFQKMKEAGYEWDADKKELKKVWQKLTELAKGEDYGIDGLYAAVDILQKTLGEVDGYQTDDGILEHECAISAVKKLYEQNPTWSEEDDYNLQCMIAKVTSDIQKGNVGRNNELIDWLKSLKSKLQR